MLTAEVNSKNKLPKAHIGSIYGQLTVIGPSIIREDHKRYWPCLCACGEQKYITDYSLRAGKSNSCGKHKPASEEHRAKLSAKKIGTKLSATTKAKIGAKVRETRATQSIARAVLNSALSAALLKAINDQPN